MPSGGYRPNAGRPKGSKGVKKKAGKKPAKKNTPPVPADIAAEAEALNLTPLEYLLKVMNDPLADKTRRDRSAAVAAPFVHTRPGIGNVKDTRKDKAKAAGHGKFKSGAPPLKVVGK